ncbi:two pore domain potassium channel family protein [Synechococcus sp. HB1133]|nr:two pore domain potassium channel family protein [Synechococcus sp. PH41509]MCB4422115.1 two pore domain potassium channel family protein [Synechococcus sp. HB1133]MCB4429938.1 two pore domain potassium channel family protein [Synechococcus sp. HBA1120]NHI81058.1 two pore domain potassium channel family protein [Synechococcus sp. HB1133]
MGLVQRILLRDGTQLKLLLLCTLIATVGFAFPRLDWATYIGYTLIALLLTQVMVGSSNAPDWSDALYRGLGLFAVATMWLWLLTPLELIYSGMPLALSWSVLVGWSVIRLVTRLASTKRVTEALLMGATAGYLHIGLTAGLVMSALETIQPGSFEPLELTNFSDTSVLASARIFSAINYFAFVCLTTVGFGDISPVLPLARMVSVATSVAGPLYLAAVMGVLIGRYASSLEHKLEDKAVQEKTQV